MNTPPAKPEDAGAPGADVDRTERLVAMPVIVVLAVIAVVRRVMVEPARPGVPGSVARARISAHRVAFQPPHAFSQTPMGAAPQESVDSRT